MKVENKVFTKNEVEKLAKLAIQARLKQKSNQLNGPSIPIHYYIR